MDVTLVIKSVVKGYHACDFNVEVGEEFVAKRKRGERGNAFTVTNPRGQLSTIKGQCHGDFALFWSKLF